MAGEFEKTEDYFKLLYVKELFQNTIDPYYALCVMAFIKLNGKNVGTAGDGATMPESSVVAIDKLVARAKLLPAPTSPFVLDKLKLDIDGEEYTFDRRLRLSITECLKQQKWSEEQINQLIAKLSLWDMLVMDAALFRAEDVIKEHNIQQAALNMENFITIKEQGDEFIKSELYELAVNQYILPIINKLDDNAESRTDIDQIAQRAEFEAAANVLSVCESQLSLGRVPEAYQPAVYKLAEETAKGLSGNFDAENYLSIVNSLPLEHSALRVIVGAALVFAGLLLAAVAITLAVHSFGLSTPLSMLGVAAGVDLMMAGAAMAVATTSLAMAGTAGFFAKSKVPGALADSAEEFHNHRAVTMGG